MRVDKPEGYKHFSKTRPLELKHLEKTMIWWNNREEIRDGETDSYKAKAFTIEELEALGYNLDQCGYPHLKKKFSHRKRPFANSTKNATR